MIKYARNKALLCMSELMPSVGMLSESLYELFNRIYTISMQYVELSE